MHTILKSVTLVVIAASLVYPAASNPALALDFSVRTVVLAAQDGTGDPAPDTGTTFCCFPRSEVERIPKLNNVGATTFMGFLQGVSGSTDEVIYKEDQGLTLVVRDGDPAPGTNAIFSSGIVFNSRDLGFNNSGNVAFNAKLLGEGILNDQGVWKEVSGLSLVARKLDEAPGTSGAQFSGIVTFGDPLISDAGNVAFAAFLDGPFVDATNNSGIWKEAGDLNLLVREGDNAPGVDSAVFGIDPPFTSTFFIGSINKHDRTAFRAYINGPSISSLTDGVWKESPGKGLVLVALEGDAAPGTGGVLFSGFGAPQLNDAGKVAFTGFAPFFSGIWKESSSLHVVVKQGDPAPGFPGASFFSFRNVELNNKGLTAFLVTTTFGPGLSVWTENFFGGPSFVVGLGDTLEVLPGDFRTIGPRHRLPLSLGGFNNLGQVGFRAGFTDFNSGGLFVATPDVDDLLDRLVNGLIGLSLSPGVEKKLLGFLQDPLDLEGFVDATEKWRGHQVEPDDADRLIDAVEQIDGLLNL